MSTDIQLAEHLLFSPEDDTEGAFLDFLHMAVKSITMCIFGFHLPSMTDILIERHHAGVDVNLLLDHSQAVGKAENSEVLRLIQAGLPFVIGTSPSHGAIMHLKATVVDAEAVEHGSWNYSTSAHLQANEMWLTRNEVLARKFIDNYDFLLKFILLHETKFQPAGEVPAHELLVGASASDAEMQIDLRTEKGRAIIHQPGRAARRPSVWTAPVAPSAAAFAAAGVTAGPPPDSWAAQQMRQAARMTANTTLGGSAI